MSVQVRTNGLSRFLGGHRSLAAVMFGVLVICVSIALGGSYLSETSPGEALDAEVAQVERIQLNPLATDLESVASNSESKRPRPNFEAQELEQLSSPFTKKTVLELNEIVGRSLNAVQEFDCVRRSARAGEPRTEAYEKLSVTAEKAQSDMEAAGKRLRESGEKYNEAIFAAMVRFVSEVDSEIRSEIAGVEIHKGHAILN